MEAQQQALAAAVPVAEVDWLLQSLTDLDRLALRLESFKQRPEIPLQVSLAQLTALWQRRVQERVPVQYLTGYGPWRQFSLKVSPAVLIPRPETECLIDLIQAAIHLYPELAQGHWADLGTGSGAIAIGLADSLPQATIHAVDTSAAALDIAQQNVQQLHLNERIQFYQGFWFEPLAQLKGALSGMVANPPYIPKSIIPTLQPEVVQHEPHLALDGGEDGLQAIRHLVAAAPTYLKSGGIWLVEMMAGQAEAVAQLLQNAGQYRDITIHPDLAGIDRFALAYRL